MVDSPGEALDWQAGIAQQAHKRPARRVSPRQWLADRYEQVKRLAPALSLLIQSATLGTVVYAATLPPVRGVVAVPLIMAAVAALAMLAAWVYYVPLNMRHYERRAQIHLTPTDVDQLTPKEAAVLAAVLADMDPDRLPRLRALVEAMRAA